MTSLRLWPGVLLAVALLVVKLIVPLVAPQVTPLTVLGGAVLGLAVGIWWLFFSRAPWMERLGILAFAAAAWFVTSRFLHVSIATGMMGYMFPIFAIPVVALALVGATVAARRFDAPRRWIVIAATVSIASGSWALLRTGGFDGNIDHDFA